MKLIEFIDYFIPLLIDIIFLILISINTSYKDLNIIVSKNYFIATYIYISIIIILFIISIILNKKVISKFRIGLFLIFNIVAVGVCPKLGTYDYYSSFILIYSALDLVIILLKYLSLKKPKNHILPVNQFTKHRKLFTRILSIFSFSIFFIICFIVFYYNEVTLSSILILLLVGIIIAVINGILVESIKLSPLNKLIKEFSKNLDFEILEKQFNLLDDEFLHPETKNLMNIILWNCSIHTDRFAYYENIVKIPLNNDLIKYYYNSKFYILLFDNKYDDIIKDHYIYNKNCLNKKYYKQVYALLTNNPKIYKLKNKTLLDKKLISKLDDIKKEALIGEK